MLISLSGYVPGYVDEYPSVKPHSHSECCRTKPSKRSKYRPGDRELHGTRDTYFGDGPYLIESVPRPGKYILCFPDGRKARNGEEVDEKDVREANDEQANETARG